MLLSTIRILAAETDGASVSAVLLLSGILPFSVTDFLVLCSEQFCVIPCFDANANVHSYCDLGGETIRALSLDPFGSILEKLQTFEQWPSFSTKRYDASTCHFEFEFRHYSPYLGRFMSYDPAYPVTGALYRFVDNNPISYIDYLGLYTIEYNDVPKTPPPTKVDEFAGLTTLSVLFITHESECPLGQSGELEDYSTSTITVELYLPKNHQGYPIARLHEDRHVAIDLATLVKLEQNGMRGDCMCNKCFYAEKQYRKRIRNMIVLENRYRNYKFDYDEYRAFKNDMIIVAMNYREQYQYLLNDRMKFAQSCAGEKPVFLDQLPPYLN